MRTHLIILGLLVSVGNIICWRSFKVIFTSFPYEVNKDFMEAKIELRNDTGESTINCHINAIDEMDDLTLFYSISLENGDGNYTSLIKRTVHFCKFLTTKSTDPILKVIYEDLLKHGSFFKSCPIKKGVYYVHDFRIDEEILPSYVPETSLAVDILLTLPNKSPPIFKGRLKGQIDKSKGFNNLKIFSLG